MYFKRFYDERLAQASYLIGCQANGTAIVIDPARVIAPYLETAAEEGLTIVAVTETHIHADFLSGLRELAAATGARMYLSGCGPAEWQYGFRDDPRVTILKDRDHITLGNVRVEAVHTPGHTPEHLVFLVTDGAAADQPIGIATGDFVFVGDVGRPDLLEKAAKIMNTAEAGARQLYRSLAWFQTLPDHLQIWPGHGAGSACGKGLGAMPQSTVGYERRFNWAFGPKTEEAFVAEVLAGQPEPPRYFARMKRSNRDGPTVLGSLPVPHRHGGRALVDLVRAGALVVDTRPTADFATGFLPGTVNLPMGKSFTTYAGSLLPYDRDLHFLLPAVTDRAVSTLVEALVSIGIDRVAGVADPEALAAWSASGQALGTVPQIFPAELAARRQSGAVVIDVRNRSEWDGGHLAGAKLIPVAEVLERLSDVPRDAELIIHCQGGGRSSVVASVLKANGFPKVANLAGGFSAWVTAGGAIER